MDSSEGTNKILVWISTVIHGLCYRHLSGIRCGPAFYPDETTDVCWARSLFSMKWSKLFALSFSQFEITEFQLKIPSRHTIAGHIICLESKQFQSKTFTILVNLFRIIKQFECSKPVDHDFTNHLHFQTNDYQVILHCMWINMLTIWRGENDNQTNDQHFQGMNTESLLRSK